MIDATQFAGLSSAAAGALGASGGALGAVWVARLLVTRMINGYDKQHTEQREKLDRVADKFTDALAILQAKVAVVEALLADIRSGRADQDAKIIAINAHLSTLSEDLWVAHRRLEKVAKGDLDIGKIQRRR